MFFDYKVSYRNLWDGNGTHYNQIITMSFADEDTFYFWNYFLQDYLHELGDGKEKYVKPLQIGDNFVSLSHRDFLAKNYLHEDKRILDRNTVIRIKIDNS